MTLAPASWPEIPISELCESIVDCVNKTAPLAEGVTPYRMLRTTNVRDGYVDVENVRYVTEETYRIWTRRQVPQRGDIILTREAPLGEVGLLRSDARVFLGQRLVAYRADPNKSDPYFILYSMMAPYVQGQIRAMGSGATVEHMRVPDAGKFFVRTPSLVTQQRIGTILSAYDELIELNRRRIAILEEMARRLFDEWFVRFRHPGATATDSGSQKTDGAPEGWRKVRLGDLLNLEYGKALRSDDRQDGQIVVYGSSGPVGYHDKALVKGPGIVVGRKGNVGSVYWSASDFYPIDTVFYVNSDLPKRWLFQLLRLQRFINSDSAVPGLNRNQAHSLEVLQPPSKLIEHYASVMEPLGIQAEILTNTNARLRAARDLLLPKLISGQIDLAGAKRELEDAA